MARKTQDEDTTPVTMNDAAIAPTQLDPEIFAELERLRAENAHLSAALSAQAAPIREATRGDGTGPQGIAVREMSSGDERKDFHPKFREKRMIDPKSLQVEGQDPYLALPIVGTNDVRIRRIEASHAAYILTCDPASGGQSVYRLATDDEVAAAEADHERRRGPAERSRQKDLAKQ